jgi:multidrug efflux pump subunit AcrA (membrane-fusion protein)
MVPAQVKAVREEAARREAALQAQIDEARSAAAAAAGGGPGGDGGDLASLLAAREAELENLQAALGELSYEVI